MEFFQGPFFNAFLALILSFVVAKIVSFAISNSSTDVNPVVCSVNEGAVAKQVTLDRELRVRSSKGQKRMMFVDDVVIRKIDRYEGSENLVLSDDFGAVGELIVEEKSLDEKSEERVGQFGENGLSEDSGVKKWEEQCFDVREMHDADAQSKGFGKVEMLIEKEGDGDSMEREDSGKEKTLVSNGLENVIVKEGNIEVKLEGDDMIITDEKDGNEILGSGENEGLVAGYVAEEGKKSDESTDDEDDDWEGVERSELEKVFAEAVNYVEYGGKGKDKEHGHLGKLSNDVQMQLYGLHKISVEGSCCEPQPMALKVSARAKWNAWQRLGIMSQEAAMEQYVRVLSDNIPGWMDDYSADDDIRTKLESVGTISAAEHERKFELRAISLGDSSTDQNSAKKGQVLLPEPS